VICAWVVGSAVWIHRFSDAALFPLTLLEKKVSQMAFFHDAGRLARPLRDRMPTGSKSAPFAVLFAKAAGTFAPVLSTTTLPNCRPASAVMALRFAALL